MVDTMDILMDMDMDTTVNKKHIPSKEGVHKNKQTRSILNQNANSDLEKRKTTVIKTQRKNYRHLIMCSRSIESKLHDFDYFFV